MNRRALLTGLLTTYSPEDPTESEYRLRMLDLLDSDDDPFSRSRFDPGLFTVSAFVLSPDRASLLMIYHEKLGRWLQPGGHVERSDTTFRAAARREVVEETGLPETALEDRLATPFDLDIHAIPRTPTEPDHLHHDLRFLFSARSMPAAPGADPHDVRWVELEQASALNPEPAMNRIMKKLAAWPAIECQEEA